MAMNDEETVALIAGGHTFGKTHGAGPATHVGPEPEAAPLEAQGLGWKSSYGTGKGGDTITSGLEVTWTTTPTKWSNDFFWNLFGYEWELTKSPAGAHQWKPKDGAGAGTVPDAHDPSKRHAPTMLTTDLALRFDPAYEKISRRFLRAPGGVRRRVRQGVVQADAPRHGAASRGTSGKLVPAEPQLWQDPVPPVTHELIGAADIAALKEQDPRVGAVHLAAGLDGLGVGVDVPRHRQARRRQRRAHSPRAAEGLGGQQSRPSWRRCCRRSRGSRRRSTTRRPAEEAGLAGRPDRAGRLRRRRAGREERRRTTCRCRSRRDARMRRRSRPTSSRSPCSSRRPTGSATTSARATTVPAEDLLIERAQMLTLTAPEMTVLVGGLRVLGANADAVERRRLHQAARDADATTSS